MVWGLSVTGHLAWVAVKELKGLVFRNLVSRLGFRA